MSSGLAASVEASSVVSPAASPISEVWLVFLSSSLVLFSSLTLFFLLLSALSASVGGSVLLPAYYPLLLPAQSFLALSLGSGAFYTASLAVSLAACPSSKVLLVFPSSTLALFSCDLSSFSCVSLVGLLGLLSLCLSFSGGSLSFCSFLDAPYISCSSLGTFLSFSESSSISFLDSLPLFPYSPRPLQGPLTLGGHLLGPSVVRSENHKSWLGAPFLAVMSALMRRCFFSSTSV